MKTLFTLAFLTIPLLSFGQFDYEIYLQYADTANRRLNKSIISATEYEVQDGNRVKTMEEQYNTEGLPVSIASFRPDGKTQEKKVFTYDEHGYIKQVDSYKPDNYSVMYRNDVPDSTKTNDHTGKCVFETNESGQITGYTDYVFSSIGSDSDALWRTVIEYYPDNQVKRKVRISAFRGDTEEISLYDPAGRLSQTIYLKRMFSYVRVDRIYASDNSEMTEIKYKEDSTPLDTVIHKYANGREVERTDPSTPQPIYWKYDSKNRLTETNEAVFYTVSFSYDDYGRKKEKIINVLFSDSGNDTDLPKKVNYKYEYQLRK